MDPNIISVMKSNFETLKGINTLQENLINDLKLKISSLESKILSLESENSNLKFEISNLKGITFN